ncbi:MAG: hypothetical protein V8T45_13195 [Oscillospiraceae bacterium]
MPETRAVRQIAQNRGAAAVLFFQGRAYHQDHHHVVDIMAVAVVAQNVEHKAGIGPEFIERSPVDAEIFIGAHPTGEVVQQQHAEGHQSKGEDHR